MSDLKKLLEQKAEIEAKIEAAKAEAKAEFAQKVSNTIEALKRDAEMLGFDLADFGVGSMKARKPRKKVEPKYCHPNNPKITWAGAGRKPKWVTEHLENGGDLGDLLINRD